MTTTILFAIVASFISVVYGQCNVTLPLDPIGSTFAFDGSVTSPVVAPLAVAPEGTITGFQGSLALFFGGECPSSGDDVVTTIVSQNSNVSINGTLAVYPASVLVSGSGEQVVLGCVIRAQIISLSGDHVLTIGLWLPSCTRASAVWVTKYMRNKFEVRCCSPTVSQPPLYPQLQSGTLVNITWRDVVFNLSVMALSDGLQQSGNRLTWSGAEAYVEIVSGGALQTSLLAVNQPVSLLGINTTSTSTIQLDTEGDQVNVTFTGLNLSMTGLYEGELGGSPLQGAAMYNLTNITLAASTVLGCSSACGTHGRCTLVNGTKTCQCACGWAGETCDTGSGFCSEFGDQDTCSGQLNEGSPPPLSPSPGPPCAAPPLQGNVRTYIISISTGRIHIVY